MPELADQHFRQSLVSENDRLAKHNQELFDQNRCFVLHFMSAPGAGKTSLLKRCVPLLNGRSAAVIEGDMVGEVDAERLRSGGIETFQIHTGRQCHLEARMMARVLSDNRHIATREYVFIENVGNLVGPAEFPVGEHRRVVLLSVTGGDDKPLKYPAIFHNCHAVVFTKCDLLPYVNFDLQATSSYLKNLNPNMRSFAVSTTDNRGISDFMGWLKETYDDHHCLMLEKKRRHRG